jgi:hypothetical protein
MTLAKYRDSCTNTVQNLRSLRRFCGAASQADASRLLGTLASMLHRECLLAALLPCGAGPLACAGRPRPAQ